MFYSRQYNEDNVTTNCLLVKYHNVMYRWWTLTAAEEQTGNRWVGGRSQVSGEDVVSLLLHQHRHVLHVSAPQVQPLLHPFDLKQHTSHWMSCFMVTSSRWHWRTSQVPRDQRRRRQSTVSWPLGHVTFGSREGHVASVLIIYFNFSLRFFTWTISSLLLHIFWSN